MQSLTEILNTRPDRENGRQDSGVNRGERDDFKHDPAEQKHLGEGANFAAPVRFDGNVGVEVVQNPDTDNDNDVSCDH